MKGARKRIVCGIDESGRGALAGPLVAAAVILPCSLRKIKKLSQTKIADGKLLSAGQRKKVYATLKRLNVSIVVEVLSARQINNRGIHKVNREAVRRLIKRIDADEYIVDGNMKLGRIKGKTDRIQTVVDADATIPQVIFAGIVAKVERDRLMHALHSLFPRYQWRRNKGYGTRRHIEALQSYGMSRFHRGIFVTTALKTSTTSTALNPRG
jgi:ribonuclease HII